MANFISPRDSSGSVASTGKSGNRSQIKRSLTELAAPVKKSRHHRKDRHHDEKVPQSAVAATPDLQQQTLHNNRVSVEMPRSEGVTPMLDPDPSRRASLMLQREEEARAANGLNQLEPKVNPEERLRQERDKATLRVEGLRESLADLSMFWTTTSRQLDDTYYAVLEKMSSLQNTITAMKDLTEASHGIRESFDKESREIENDITAQLASLGQFEEQQGNIESLQTRIQEGRAKIRSLSDRVDAVRERVEGWERADKHWQEKTRKRLKAIWIAMSVIALVLILLFVGSQYVPPDLDIIKSDSATPTRVAESVLSSRDVSPTGRLVNFSHAGGDGVLLPKKPAEDGQRLRVFDEL